MNSNDKIQITNLVTINHFYLFDQNMSFNELISDAIKHGNVEQTIQQLIKQHDFNINARDEYGDTILHQAAVFATHDNGETINLILERGANINATNKFNQTPLYSSMSDDGNDTIASILINRGADINILGNDNNGSTLLHFAACFDLVNAARLLIERDVDINARDNDGLTPLHYASSNGSYEIVKLLLEHNADINAKSNYGHTPLHVAAGYHCFNVITLLLEHGADITARDNNNLTVLHYAVHPMYKVESQIDIPNAIQSTTILLNHLMNNQDTINIKDITNDVVNIFHC